MTFIGMEFVVLLWQNDLSQSKLDEQSGKNILIWGRKASIVMELNEIKWNEKGKSPECNEHEWNDMKRIKLVNYSRPPIEKKRCNEMRSFMEFRWYSTNYDTINKTKIKSAMAIKWVIIMRMIQMCEIGATKTTMMIKAKSKWDPSRFRRNWAQSMKWDECHSEMKQMEMIWSFGIRNFLFVGSRIQLGVYPSREKKNCERNP